MEHEVTFEGFRTIEFPNVPVLQAKLPEPVMTYLWQLIDVAKNNPKDLKSGLAGNISTSFELHDEQKIFETFCVPSLKSVDKKNTIPGPDEKPEIKKIKKQATEKRIYNLKDFVVYLFPF